MIWYNDDDIEKKQTNWQNSEVMRIFAAQYLDPKLAAEEEESKRRSAEDIRKYLDVMEENAELYPGGKYGLLYQESRRIVERELSEAMAFEGRGSEDDCGDGMPMGKMPVAIVVKENMRSELDYVIQKLAGLASEYGNEKVRYKMERAIDELRAIQSNGE